MSPYIGIRGVAAALGQLKATGDWDQFANYVSTDNEFFEFVELREFAGQYDRYRVE